MNIRVVCIDYPVSSARYITDALDRLGHRVSVEGVALTGAARRMMWGMPIPVQHIWKHPMQTAFAGKADLVILADSDPQILNLAEYYADKGEKVVVWGVDNHVRDYRSEGISHYFLAHIDSDATEWNGADCTWLPCAYDPVHFSVTEQPQTDWLGRSTAVASIAVQYPHRQSANGAIKAHLKDNDLAGLFGTGLIYDDYAAAYRSSKVSFVMSANNDLAQRVFETAALGCMVVCDDVAALEAMSCPAITYEQAYTVPHLAAMSEYKGLLDAIDLGLNATEDQRRALLEWVKPHTWDNRAKQVLEVAL